MNIADRIRIDVEASRDVELEYQAYATLRRAGQLSAIALGAYVQLLEEEALTLDQRADRLSSQCDAYSFRALAREERALAARLRVEFAEDLYSADFEAPKLKTVHDGR